MLRFDATEILKNVDKAQEVLRQTADDVLDIAKQLAPVDTGALKASGMREEINPNYQIVGFGNEQLDYARHQEYGTAVMSAQPFLTPAMAQAKSIVEARAKEIM